MRPAAGSSWGTWGDSEFCPENSWASGYQLRHEPSCGDICDDTELNAVKLFCATKDGQQVAEVTSKKGGFGGWMANHSCDGDQSFINGVEFRSEKVDILRRVSLQNNHHIQETKGKSKHLDETAGNNVNMACSHGSVLPGDGGDFGTWSDFEICSENEAVCGIRTLGNLLRSFIHISFFDLLVEDPQGVFTDDTSLNQIILYCCIL